MIISVNWLKKFTNIDLPITELAKLIGERLVEIESIEDLGAKYKGVVIAKVIECSRLENSDHLNVTKIDDGGNVSDIERDENGFVQVVCGAPNVRSGMTVAWLPPRSTVPQSYGTDEPFVLDARKLRGVVSNGMLASARELDLFDDHEGILEVDNTYAAGTNFADAYELNDYLLDIENKSLTHRPDCFGIIGFAREVAAIQGIGFTTPDWLTILEPTMATTVDSNVQAPTIYIDDPELSRRYQAIVMQGADSTAKSSLQMQTYLARVGMRPINAVVDVTNYLMMLTGQPLHAFDYDKLIAIGGDRGKATIHVRAGRSNETLALLDGRTIALTEDDIVIASGETPVALGGAMGGIDTEIDETTTSIIIECATFNLFKLRATQMRHGIFTEAITRLTKGQPAEQTAPVLAEAVKYISEFTGARIVTNMVDAYPGKEKQITLGIHVSYINGILGSQFDGAVISSTLQHAEFNVSQVDDEMFEVTPPYWRADIHITEDIVEEVGRINGFDTIAPMLPVRDFTAVKPIPFDSFRDMLRGIMARAGANEVLTYSFVHGDMLVKANQKLENSYRITNAISPTLQYYRQTLTPSLLSVINANIRTGIPSFAVFELNKTHNKVHGLNDEGLPGELNMFAMTLANNAQYASPSAYYSVRRYLDFIAEQLHMSFSYTAITEDPGYPVTAPFEWRRSAYVSDAKTGEFIGIVGEYKKSVVKNFKLPTHVAGFEIGPEALLKAYEAQGNSYKPLSRFPGTSKDVCLQVAPSVSYEVAKNALVDALEVVELSWHVEPVDIYQPEDASFKNVTFRIMLNDAEKTITADTANQIVAKASKSAATNIGAEII